jgi:serine/threonine protein kinase
MVHIHNQILPSGTRLGVYEIKEAVKVDTFCVTYFGFNHHLKETVEIQEYFPCDFAVRADDGIGVELKNPKDKEVFDFGLKAFLDQAEILTQIDHPNIAKAENLLPFYGTAYLIMTHPKGASLAKLAESKDALPETELKALLLALLDALKIIHKHEIVHGGIQPETIIMGKNGEPLLTSFAGAKLAFSAHTCKVVDGISSGYMAPELVDHIRAPGPETDFYALGATFYHCITHKKPMAADNRLVSLNKGELDPITALSGLPGIAYNKELMQVIDWMLLPKYINRPHTTSEILTLINSGGQADSSQNDAETRENSTIEKKPFWIGGMVGILVLALAGLWLAKKPPEKTQEQVKPSIAEPLVQNDADKNTASSIAKNEPAISLPQSPDIQASERGKVPNPAQEALKEPENKPLSAQQEIRPELRPEAQSAKENIKTESKPGEISKPVVKQKPESKVTVSNKTVKKIKESKKINEQVKPKIQQLPANRTDEDTINGNLAAAKKAMKEVRFTTPSGNNAYQYYQKVLEKEPDNTEALAGLQRIASRYAGYIRKSNAEGKRDRAKRVLQKAESVFPNHPAIVKVREELSNTEK